MATAWRYFFRFCLQSTAPATLDSREKDVGIWRSGKGYIQGSWSLSARYSA